MRRRLALLTAFLLIAAVPSAHSRGHSTASFSASAKGPPREGIAGVYVDAQVTASGSFTIGKRIGHSDDYYDDYAVTAATGTLELFEKASDFDPAVFKDRSLTLTFFGGGSYRVFARAKGGGAILRLTGRVTATNNFSGCSGEVEVIIQTYYEQNIYLAREGAPNNAGCAFGRGLSWSKAQQTKVSISGGQAPAQPKGTLRLSWKLPDRFGLDEDGDELIDYPTSAAVVNPFDWPVTVLVRGCDPKATYTFSTASGRRPSERDERSGPCAFRVRFPREGAYTLKATAALPGGTTAEGTAQVTVQDWLVVGIGDSAGSGEGVPDQPGPRNPVWEFERCHRSARSFEALAALRVEEASVLTSVTFVHVACSGAGIREGAVGPYFGIAPGGATEPLLEQIADAKRLTSTREVDAVIASIGVNDIGFGAVIKFCIEFRDCLNHAYQGRRTLANVVQERLDRLPDLYGQLAVRIRRLAEPDRVFLTEYFDPLRDDIGQFCESIAVGIDQDEASGLGRVLEGLNEHVRRAAGKHGWRFVGGAQGRFRDHGYCAGDESWIVTLPQSLAGQGDHQGTLHPNRRGHGQLASIVYPELRRGLYPGGKPRPPR